VIGVVWAMIRVRATNAVILALLALLAVAAAVSAPRYVEAARASVTRVDLQGADRSQLTVGSSLQQIARATGDPRTDQAAFAQRARDFPNQATVALTIPGFTTTFAVGYFVRASAASLPEILVPEDVPFHPQYWLEFRDGVCGHLHLSAGRCPAASGEVLVGRQTADELGVHPGSPLNVQNMTFADGGIEQAAFWSPTGMPGSVSVVGVYDRVDPTDPFFTGTPPVNQGGAEPVYADRRTVAAIDHDSEIQRVLAYPAGSLSAEDFADLTPRIRDAIDKVRTLNGQPATNMPLLLDKIQADRSEVGVLPGVLELPLLVLCCFVIFLAASNTAQARRTELGMLKLRGAAGGDRFGLAAGELVAPLVVGGVLGFLIGQVAVWFFARLVLVGPTPFAISMGDLPRAGLALLAVVVAGLLGLRRDLVAPVAELLRRVPPRTARWGSAVLLTLVVVLGAAAVYQVRSSDSTVSGLGVLAPAAVILAVCLLLVTAFDPLAGATGRRALRRGRIGAALALLHLGRRRTGSRVVALIGVAVGLLTFVAVAFGTGTQARTDQVVAKLGAYRVVSVPEISMRTLMYDVRKADPDGTFAMAAMPIGVGAPIMAVDSPRLAEIGPWPNQSGGGLGVAGAKAALRPQLAPSVEITGTQVTVTAGMSPATAKARVRPALVLAPLDGKLEQYVRLDPTAPGADTYSAAVDCPAGCRLAALAITDFEPRRTASQFFGGGPVSTADPVTLTMSRIVQSGPDRELVSPADFATWDDRQAAGELTLTPSDAGVQVLVGKTFTGGNPQAWIGPSDQPDQLPMVAPDGVQNLVLTIPLPIPTVSPGTRFANGVTPVVPAKVAGEATVLPRVGTSGVLVDMEYLTRIGEPGPARTGGEVWLGPNAPADALDRLRAAGLSIAGERNFDDEMKRASGGPNSTGLQFLLAIGLLCLILGGGGLGVAATVELRARGDELRSLRRQGASRWVVARAGWQSYLMTVAAGAVIGAIAAAVAWLATRDSLPVVDQLVAGVPVPEWPGPIAVWAWSGATGVLGLIAVALTIALSGATRTVSGRSRR